MKRRRWFEVHSWIGVATGLLLFVVCWSGTTAVLSYEIDWLLDARLRVEPARAGETASWGALYQTVRRVHPDAVQVVLHSPPYRCSAAFADVELPGERIARVYLDPYNADYRGSAGRLNVQRFFRDLHMALFDVGNAFGGYWIVGAFSVVLFVSTMTPLMFYRRWWRSFLLPSRRPRGSHALWSELHKMAGVWGLLFSLLIALTGFWYLMEWADPIAYPETPQFASSSPVELTPTDLDTLVRRAATQWPNLEIRSVGLPEGSHWGGVVSLDGQAEAVLVRDRSNRLFLDPETGATRFMQRADELPWPARWIDTADPLHFGNFAGLGIKAVWFVFGLLLSGMSLTGTYLHARRLAALRHPIRPRTRAAGMWATVLLLSATVALAKNDLESYFTSTPPGVDPITSATAGFLAVWTVGTLLLVGGFIGLLTRAPPPTHFASAKRSIRPKS
ncbi:MAG TPA: PepSY-associated TM helix domain-containing protein [Vicinamibacterales bacterium]|nr:PepSY-associated TM helix domain-containing protein [Vicinamibacterales bacterium]